jgi:hypothetical protein
MILQTDKLVSGDIFGYAIDIFTAVVPTPILALVIFGTVGVGYYMTQRSMAIPMIMFIMIGGVTIAEAPVNFQQGIVGAMVFGVAGIGYVLLQRART